MVQNIFNDPVNGLKSVARYSKATGTACRAWAQQRALTAEELLPDAPPVPLAGPGAARESIDEMRASATKLIALVDAAEADYDVVVGFSQGGEYAIQLAARLDELTIRKPPKRFVMIGSQVDFVFNRYEAAGAPLDYSKGRVGLTRHNSQSRPS